MFVRNFKTQHFQPELLRDDFFFLLLSLTKLLYHQEGKDICIFKHTLSSGEYKNTHKSKYSDRREIKLSI